MVNRVLESKTYSPEIARSTKPWTSPIFTNRKEGCTRKQEKLGLVVEALTLLRAMQERLISHEGTSDVSIELAEAVKRLEIFLARSDKFAAKWWEEFRLILDLVLTVLRLYFDFLQ